MTLETYLSQDTKVKELTEKISKYNTTGEETHQKAIKGLSKDGNADDVTLFHKLNDELEIDGRALDARKSFLKLEWDKLEAEANAGRTTTVNAVGGGAATSGMKSLSQSIMESSVYKSIPELANGRKNWDRFRDQNVRFEIPRESFAPEMALRTADVPRGMKDITTSTFATLPMLLPTFVPTPVYPATVWNVLPTFQLENPSVTYRQEQTHTNNAAATTEAVRISSASASTAILKTDNIQNIAGYYKLSEQEMRSRPDIMDVFTFFANRDLGIAVETEVFTGSGSPPHLNGIYNQATTNYTRTAQNWDGSPQTNIDALAYAWLNLRVTGVCVPDMTIIHPYQFLPIRLQKDALGNYIFGDPMEDKVELYVFGVRMLQSLYAVQGQALMGDFRSYYSLGIYMGINVELGFDGNDFTTYERTLRFGMMCVNQVRRPASFSVITGLDSAI